VTLRWMTDGSTIYNDDYEISDIGSCFVLRAWRDGEWELVEEFDLQAHAIIYAETESAK
jgi:hypothetical protein